METLDQIISKLRPSEQVKISGDDVNYCHVERSGKGDVIRFVRTLGNTTTVFKTINAR